MRRFGLATIGVVLVVAGCGGGAGPSAPPPSAQPVDYLGVFTAQEESLRTLAAADPVPSTAQEANTLLGWDDDSPYRTVAFSPDQATVCTTETATDRFVSRVEQDGKDTQFWFSTVSCAPTAAAADAVIVIPDSGPPSVPVGSADVASVVGYLAGATDRADAARSAARTAARLGRALDAARQRTGTYPGVAAEELAAELDVTVPDAVRVVSYLPTGTEAQLCVAADATGAWAVYETVARSVTRTGATGATC